MRKYVVLGVFALATTAVPIATGGAERAAGTLDLRGTVAFLSNPTTCPAGTREVVVCHGRTGTAPIPGLGRVTETYVYMADPTPCPNEAWTILSYDARLSVEGKGDLNLRLAGIPLCIPAEGVPGASPQAFTVTSGTGIYAGASGSGTLTRIAGFPGVNVRGADTWTGTISVPGVGQFDLTAPTISGAKPKAVRRPRKAKRVRVTYQLTATDDVDGAVPVSCRPASGSRFKIGRTKVTCSASDKSGNTATASFTVTVARRR
jgi:HYR domain